MVSIPMQPFNGATLVIATGGKINMVQGEVEVEKLLPATMVEIKILLLVHQMVEIPFIQDKEAQQKNLELELFTLVVEEVAAALGMTVVVRGIRFALETLVVLVVVETVETS